MRRRTKPKTHESIEATMKRLKAYCDEQRGRQMQVARALLVDRTQVLKWIQRGGNPRVEQYCHLIDFLEHQENKTTQ